MHSHYHASSNHGTPYTLVYKFKDRNCKIVTQVSYTKQSSDCVVGGGGNKFETKLMGGAIMFLIGCIDFVFMPEFGN